MNAKKNERMNIKTIRSFRWLFSSNAECGERMSQRTRNGFCVARSVKKWTRFVWTQYTNRLFKFDEQKNDDQNLTEKKEELSVNNRIGSTNRLTYVVCIRFKSIELVYPFVILWQLGLKLSEKKLFINKTRQHQVTIESISNVYLRFGLG